MGDVNLILYNDDTGVYVLDGEGADCEWEPSEDGVMFEDEAGDYFLVHKDEMLILDVEVEEGLVTEYYKKVDYLMLQILLYQFFYVV